mmetsp:Transcript_22295/g.51128  ORF Transcript_22295/g.51128 Transcript_22295/m.51128 type:complete len:332 (-) Transcript_22295:346-1341(-)
MEMPTGVIVLSSVGSGRASCHWPTRRSNRLPPPGGWCARPAPPSAVPTNSTPYSNPFPESDSSSRTARDTAERTPASFVPTYVASSDAVAGWHPSRGVRHEASASAEKSDGPLAMPMIRVVGTTFTVSGSVKSAASPRRPLFRRGGRLLRASRRKSTAKPSQPPPSSPSPPSPAMADATRSPTRRSIDASAPDSRDPSPSPPGGSVTSMPYSITAVETPDGSTTSTAVPSDATPETTAGGGGGQDQYEVRPSPVGGPSSPSTGGPRVGAAEGGGSDPAGPAGSPVAPRVGGGLGPGLGDSLPGPSVGGGDGGPSGGSLPRSKVMSGSGTAK